MTIINGVETNLLARHLQEQAGLSPNGSFSGYKVDDSYYIDRNDIKGNKCTDGKDDGKIGLGSALYNSVKGVGKTIVNGVKAMFLDGNGKFSLKRTLISAATAALCFAVPPVGVAACCVGVAAGAVQVGKGIYKAFTAKTDAQAKDAWQNVGGGAFTTVVSAIGAKASYKAMQTSAAKGFIKNGELVNNSSKLSNFNNSETGKLDLKLVNKDKIGYIKALFADAKNSVVNNTMNMKNSVVSQFNKLSNKKAAKDLNSAIEKDTNALEQAKQKELETLDKNHQEELDALKQQHEQNKNSVKNTSKKKLKRSSKKHDLNAEYNQKKAEIDKTYASDKQKIEANYNEQQSTSKAAKIEELKTKNPEAYNIYEQNMQVKAHRAQLADAIQKGDRDASLTAIDTLFDEGQKGSVIKTLKTLARAKDENVAALAKELLKSQKSDSIIRALIQDMKTQGAIDTIKTYLSSTGRQILDGFTQDIPTDSLINKFGYENVLQVIEAISADVVTNSKI